MQTGRRDESTTDGGGRGKVDQWVFVSAYCMRFVVGMSRCALDQRHERFDDINQLSLRSLF